MKTGRNDPCRCGSGRKYKHCCRDRKPLTLTVDASTNGDPDGVVLNLATREFSFHKNGNAMPLTGCKLIISYERDNPSKGEKVISRLSSVGPTVSYDPAKLLGGFTYLFAVDTNTRRAGDRTICAASVVFAITSPRGVTPSTTGGLRLHYCQTFEFWNPTGDAEKAGVSRSTVSKTPSTSNRTIGWA